MKSGEQTAGVEKPAERTEEGRIAGDGKVATDSAGAGGEQTGQATIGYAFEPLKQRAERWRAVLEPEPLRASYHVRSGVSVALIVVLTTLAFWLFHKLTVFRPYIAHTAILMGLCGLGLYFLQRRKPGANLNEDYVLHFYLHPRYWSFIVLVSAVLIFTLCSSLLVVEKDRVAPQPQPVAQQPISEPEQELPPSPEPIEFPALELSGVVLNGDRSSAVINGDTVQLGEYIQGVKLVEVLEDGVVVELDGEQRDVALTDASAGSNQK